MAARRVDPEGPGAEVRLLRLEDAGHEGLRVAVVEREPAALHLDQDAVVGSTPQMGYVRVSFTFGVLEPAASERLELSILDMVLQQLGR